MKQLLRLIHLLLLIGISTSGFSLNVKETKQQSNVYSDVQAKKGNTMIEKNTQKFALLKKYNLPLGEYAIGGSGPLGIRGIREINDIDILVSNSLRDILVKRYGMVDDGKVKKIVFPEDDIEAFWEGSSFSCV